MYTAPHNCYLTKFLKIQTTSTSCYALLAHIWYCDQLMSTIFNDSMTQYFQSHYIFTKELLVLLQ